MCSPLLLLVLLSACFCQIIHLPLNKKLVSKQTLEANNMLEEDSYQAQLDNYQQQQYSGMIVIGANNQQFEVVFDIGSNVLWLASTLCTADSCSSNFDNQLSCSIEIGCQKTDNEVTMAYAFGTAYGTVASVPVSFPGLAKVPQDFLLVSKTANFEYLQADGKFGLGVYNDQRFGAPSAFVLNMYKAGQIPKAMFSFYLGFQSSNSQLTLGGYDQTKMQNSANIYSHEIMTNGQINQKQRWSFQGGPITFGDLIMPYTQNSRFLVDTGISMLAFNSIYFVQFVQILQDDYQATYDEITNVILINCSATPPDFIVKIPDIIGVIRTYTIPYNFYIQKNLNGDCQVLARPLDVPDVQVILGVVFMHRYVSIFDYNSLTISLSLSIATPISLVENNGFPTWAIVSIVDFVLIIIAAVILYRKQQQGLPNYRKDIKAQLLVNHSYTQSVSQPSQIIGRNMINGRSEASNILPIKNENV